MTNEPRRTRLLASGLLILTFVAGGLAGAASERMLRAREPDQPTPSANGRRPDRGRPRGPRSILLEPTVLDQLGVNEEQRRSILAELASRDTASQKLWSEMEPRMNAIWKEYEPRWGTILEQSRARIRSQLDSVQLTKLDSMIRVRREQRTADQKARNHNGPEPHDSGKTKTEHFE